MSYTQAARGRARGSRAQKRKGSETQSSVTVKASYVKNPPGQQKSQYHFTELAQWYWIAGGREELDINLVEGIYTALQTAGYATRSITVLELSHYLENYLWLRFEPSLVTKPLLMSIILMVNEKFREHVPAWEVFLALPEHFGVFFRMIMELALTPLESGELSMKERTILLDFLIHCFNSFEVDLVRKQVQMLVSLTIWTHLLPSRLEQEFSKFPRLRDYWKAIQEKNKKMDDDARQRQQCERSFLFELVNIFFRVLESISFNESEPIDNSIVYCEKMIELLIDIETQPSTRRFFNTLMDDMHLIVRCQQSNLAKMEFKGHLFNQLLSQLKYYSVFEINDLTYKALTEHEMITLHDNSITLLQMEAFKRFPDLRRFSLSTVAGVDTREALYKHFKPLSPETLHKIAAHLKLAPSLGDAENTPLDHTFLLEVLVSRHERRQSQLETLNSTPLYPTERVLWDKSLVPYEYKDDDGCLALPKLNLQFLTLHDYLYRNFTLFQLESTYEIRQDVEEIVTRMRPWVNPEGETLFAGWARMAQCISAFSVVEVGKPNIGENRPSRVKADVTINVKIKDPVRREWEALRKHDVCFLLSVKAKMALHEGYDESSSFPAQVGLAYVRGCEVEGMLDNEGKVIEEGPEPKPEVKGETRTFRMWLDTNQYQKDMEDVVKGEEDVYETFNILMRRKPKENNFKAVLETIRYLINTECVVPNWLHNILLGHGEPSAAHYTRMPGQARTLDFNDTFLSLDHVVHSFPQYQVECTVDDPEKQVPPFKLMFPDEETKKRRHPDSELKEEKNGHKPVLLVTPYTIPNRGPYPYNQPKKNTVPFVPTQVEAIRAGMQPGLTMVVGPPGTGKTDVAVQIISNIYHNFPNQRTLLITHSNQALNQLFEKIMALDIDNRHLLRLGHGEEELQTDQDFSRYGRVNFILALRLELLKEVERLRDSLNVSGDVSYTCETAGYFYNLQVLSRWDQYCSKVKPLADKPSGVEAIAQEFPFTGYFSNAPQPLFNGRSFAEDWDIAEGCFRHIKKIFKQLEEFRAFEILRSSRHRVEYLLMKEAKIIALTCTHAALKRKDLVDIAFKYDNVLMEESAQILEIETFIPLVLQNPQDGRSRLKRIIMIGDHHQLPPVIQNMAFQKFSNMEQSLFARFVRLGVPIVQLDAQGRARPSLCSLYKWRYKTLGDLPHVLNSSEYQFANAGLHFDYQLVNVEDFNGVGENTPSPYFYQNLAEAEYAVGLFMYMRLQGYPPDKIAILTTYNGQKHLIRDVLQKRCARNPVFGLPEKVTTVDRYQGQQNDYIILSLVRTKHVGHLRDVRRLVVAMSRARLGLYILARVSLFSGCRELQPAFNILMQRPLDLHLVPDEVYPTNRPIGAPPLSPLFVVGGMSQIADFVFQEYHRRIAALQAAHQMAPPPTEQEEQEKVEAEEMETDGEMREEEQGEQDMESSTNEGTVEDNTIEKDIKEAVEEENKEEENEEKESKEEESKEKESKEEESKEEESKEEENKEAAEEEEETMVGE